MRIHCIMKNTDPRLTAHDSSPYSHLKEYTVWIIYTALQKYQSFIPQEKHVTAGQRKRHITSQYNADISISHPTLTPHCYSYLLVIHFINTKGEFQIFYHNLWRENKISLSLSFSLSLSYYSNCCLHVFGD